MRALAARIDAAGEQTAPTPELFGTAHVSRHLRSPSVCACSEKRRSAIPRLLTKNASANAAHALAVSLHRLDRSLSRSASGDSASGDSAPETDCGAVQPRSLPPSPRVPPSSPSLIARYTGRSPAIAIQFMRSASSDDADSSVAARSPRLQPPSPSLLQPTSSFRSYVKQREARGDKPDLAEPAHR